VVQTVVQIVVEIVVGIVVRIVAGNVGEMTHELKGVLVVLLKMDVRVWVLIHTETSAMVVIDIPPVETFVVMVVENPEMSAVERTLFLLRDVVVFVFAVPLVAAVPVRVLMSGAVVLMHAHAARVLLHAVLILFVVERRRVVPRFSAVMFETVSNAAVLMLVVMLAGVSLSVFATFAFVVPHPILEHFYGINITKKKKANSNSEHPWTWHASRPG
jgi:hypothetical protein